MGLFGKAPTIEWKENSGNVIFEKWDGCTLKRGTRLVIRTGQDAIVMCDGKMEAIFEDEGSFELDRHPGKWDIIFINTREMLVKWGTQNPVMIRDEKEGKIVPIRAFGVFSCKVDDYLTLIDKIAGIKIKYTIEDIRDHVISLLGQLLMKWICSEGKDIFNLQMNAAEISKGIREDLDMQIMKNGITITDFSITSFSVGD